MTAHTPGLLPPPLLLLLLSPCEVLKSLVLFLALEVGEPLLFLLSAWSLLLLLLLLWLLLLWAMFLLLEVASLILGVTGLCAAPFDFDGEGVEDDEPEAVRVTVDTDPSRLVLGEVALLSNKYCFVLVVVVGDAAALEAAALSRFRRHLGKGGGSGSRG